MPRVIVSAFAAVLLSSCNVMTSAAPAVSEADIKLVDRLTWGVNATELARFAQLGRQGWIDAQFVAHPLVFPAAVAAAVGDTPVVREQMGRLATDAEDLQETAKATADEAARAALMTSVGTTSKAFIYDSVDRSVMRDIYSADQLREQMTWFWFNHFNVRIAQRPLPTMVHDYVERTIRPRAFGKFCALVGATLRHPAMLFYLNNQTNVAGKINENYARELMELHTMGIGSGYTQGDVKELARVLTGARADLTTWPAQAAPPGGFRDGLFVFDPAKHDSGAKTLLGQRIQARGYGEIDEATALLCRQPATARRISAKIAQYMVADEPPPALVDRMTATFAATDGDIEAVLRTMIASPEFNASLGTHYKDAQRYLLSALRLSFDGKPISDPRVASQMLATLGQSRFSRPTPDGYSLSAAGWNSAGQLATRFQTAGVIGRGGYRLFSATDAASVSPPDIKGILAETGIHRTLAPETVAALAQARGDSEWNKLFLASPEFMRK